MTMTKFSRINKQREEITMRVLEDMEKGGNEWKKPWVEASPLPPHNPVPARSANSSRMPIRSCPMRSLPAGWACLRPSLRP